MYKRKIVFLLYNFRNAQRSKIINDTNHKSSLKR